MVCIVASAVLVRWGLADHRAGPPRRLADQGRRGVGARSRRPRAAGHRLDATGHRSRGRRLRERLLRLDGVHVPVRLRHADLAGDDSGDIALRYRRIPFPGTPEPGEASGDRSRTAHDIENPLSLVRAELTALSFDWSFLAGIPGSRLHPPRPPRAPPSGAPAVPIMTTFTSWNVDPPLLLVLLSAYLYWRGGRRQVSACRSGLERRGRAWLFYSGLAVIWSRSTLRSTPSRRSCSPRT